MAIDKIGIGLPLTDQKVFTSFFVSFVTMEKPNGTLLLPRWPGNHDAVRNDIVNQAIDEGCSHIIMMDTDQVYPPDTITKMVANVNGNGVQVVGGRIHRRYPPFDPILYRGEISKYHHVPDDECYSGDLVEVDATGCGCILYDISIFFEFDPPWFELTIGADGKPIGEDIGFCSKLRDAGIKIYVDTSIDIGHLTLMEVNRETYALYKKLKKFGWRPPPAGNNKKEIEK